MLGFFLQEIQLLVGFFGLLGIVAGSGVVPLLGAETDRIWFADRLLNRQAFLSSIMIRSRVFAVFCILYGGVTMVVAFPRFTALNQSTTGGVVEGGKQEDFR